MVSCGWYASCDNSTHAVVCTCNSGYYSPSGDATKNKDCLERVSIANIGLEFTLGSDYKWENGKVKFVNKLGEWQEGSEDAARSVIKTIIRIIINFILGLF